MATEFRQELPRRGGYAPVDFSVKLPKRGPNGYMIILGGVGVMAYGFYNVVRGNRNRCELKKEEMNARIAILPLLQAEHDRKVLKALIKSQEEEALIMKDVKNWKVGESVYNTSKWVTPLDAQTSEF